MTENHTSHKITEDKERAEALAEWRQQNWRKILKKNQAVLEQIRDNPNAKDKDRTEACKLLARMADILTPEKIVSAPKPTRSEANWWEQELNSGEKEELESILNSKK